MSEPVTVTAETLRAWPLPEPESSTKHSRGLALVVGGTRETPGAVLLAAEAALRAGCGKVRIATVASTAPALAVALPEARVYGLEETTRGHLATSAAERLADLASEADATLVGPGFVDPDPARGLVAAMAAGLGDTPLVLDALATAWLDDRPRLGPATVVTANPSELDHVVTDAVEDDPAAAVAALVEATGAAVLLGGETKLVRAPGTTTYAVRAGGTGLATAGSGDVQAGLVVGLLARGADPLHAAVWAGWLHATAGERLAARVGSTGFLARELPGEVPRLLDEVLGVGWRTLRRSAAR